MLSETRWTLRAVCFKRILDNYSVLWTVFKYCLQNNQMKTELKLRIIGLKTQMEYFHLFFGLNLGHNFFSHTDNLSKTLQAKKMSACSSKRLAELTIQVLQNMRDEHSFNSFDDTVANKSTECEFIQDPFNPRERKWPNYSTVNLVNGTTSEAQDFHPTTCQDCYWVMYCNVLNNVLTSLKQRFNLSSFVVYKNTESLLLKTIKGEDTSNESEYIKRIYNDEINITQLEIEADALRAIFYKNKVDCFDGFLSEIGKLLREQLLFVPCTVPVRKLLLVNPATTSTAERSFSTARRIKTWMRSNIIPVIFNV